MPSDDAPNIVPAHTAAHYIVRARTLDEMAESAVFYFRERETDPAAAAKFLTPESADRFTSGFAQLATAGQEGKDEFEVVAKDGTAR